MRVEAVPGMIAAAGEPAVVAYRAFFDDPFRSAATRKLYRQRAALLPLGRVARLDPGVGRCIRPRRLCR